MQKGKYYDRLFLHWLGGCLAVCAAILALMVMSGTARADTIYVDSTGTAAIGRAPNGSTIYGSHINPSGIYNTPNGPVRMTVPPGAGTSNAHYGKSRYVGGAAGGVVHGVKELNVIMKDTHGATASGKIKTTTTLPSSNVLVNTASAMVIGQVAGQGVRNADNNGFGEAIVDGRYGEAARVASAGVADAVYGGAFSGIYGMISGIQDAKADKAAAEARANLAAWQAQAAASSNQQGIAYVRVVHDVRATDQNGSPVGRNVSYKYFIVPASYKVDRVNSSAFSPGLSQQIIVNGEVLYSYTSKQYEHSYITLESTNRANYLAHGAPQPNKDDFFINETEIQLALFKALGLNSQSTNLNTEALNNLANALWASGGLNAGNTTTTVDSNQATNNTFLTSAYTPAGTNTPQQTQFQVAPDGTVSATTIPRPDLAPHSSQAPTRAEIPTAPVPGNPSTTVPGETKPTEPATASQPDICASNPDAAMCAELGNADYEDPVIPEHQQRLDFNPANIFNTGGQCPQPKRITLMNTEHEFSYQPMCDFAHGARPMLIALGMVLAMGMAYRAAQEL